MPKFLNRTAWALLLLGIFAWGCVSESNDDTTQDDTDDLIDSLGEVDNRSDSDTTQGDGVPVFGAISVKVDTGTFWHFGWDSYEKTSSGFDSNSSQTDEAGEFWLELGSATVAGGVTIYEILLSGDTEIGGDLVTRWKYLGFAEDKIYVSMNGTTLVELFDAGDGEWPGTGFFTTFDETQTFTGYQGQLENDYITTDAIIVSAGSSSDQCSYDHSTGQTFCDDVGSVSDQKQEYYSIALGILGYYKYFQYSELTYDWQYSSTTETNIGLMGSSLLGDAMEKPAQINGVSPESGTYDGAQTVSVSTTPADASIRYTTDGTDPSATNGTEVTGTGDKTFTVETNTPDLRIVAYAPQMSTSEIVTRNYLIINVISFVEDGDGAIQFYNNNPDEYGWYYYHLDPVYTGSTIGTMTTEVEVTKLSGSDSYGAGLVFGATALTDSFFYFQISSNGYYNIYRWDTPDVYTEIVPWTQSYTIHTGLDESNILKVSTAQTPAGPDSMEASINGVAVESMLVPGVVGPYSGFIAFIGTEEYEDFPDTPVDVRFRMIAPVTAP